MMASITKLDQGHRCRKQAIQKFLDVDLVSTSRTTHRSLQSTNSSKFIVFVILFIQLYIQPICYSQKYTASDNKQEISLHSQMTQKNYVHDDLPILLWWTSALAPYENLHSLSKIKCSFGDCLTTANRKYVNDKRTNLLLFYGTDVSAADLPLPRRPWHLWALYHEESPLNNYILCHQTFLRLFNYTATCRRESDYPLTMQWILDNEYFTSRPPVSVEFKNKYRKERGYAPVLYIQSHCAVPSDRDRYVKELMKYISIDSYGKCLKNKDFPDDFTDPAGNLYNQDFYDFIAPYKFHLAFENAYLEDYMTEKLMRTLHLGSIPIYKGAPNAQDWMPNDKSVIFVDDFSSPKDLAEYITRLDKDDKEYESYLKYKTEGISNSFLKQMLKSREWRINKAGYPHVLQSYECYLCNEITRLLSLKEKHTIQAKYANKSHFGCSQPYPLMVNPEDVPRGDVWHEVDWIELYWMGLDHALVADEMIRSGENDSSKFRSYLRRYYNRRNKP